MCENNAGEDKRVALIGIIVSDGQSVEKLNALLHEYGQCIVGRFGLPMRERGVNVISVVLDARSDEVNALTGKLGALPGVNAKAMFRKSI